MQNKIIEYSLPQVPYNILQYGEYYITPIKLPSETKYSFWISKRGCMTSLYCFSIDENNVDEYHLQTQAIVLDSYIHYFEDSIKTKSCNNYLINRKAFKSMNYNDYCECVSSIMVEMGYYLTPFIQQINYELKDIQDDLKKICILTAQLKKLMMANNNSIYYEEPDGSRVETIMFSINDMDRYYLFSGIVTRSGSNS